MSLQREYRRDVGRYLASQRDNYPAIPSDYFDAETEYGLAEFESRARVERNPALIAELPRLAVRADAATGAAVRLMFRNWLQYLAGSEVTLARAS
jgi:homoserine O-succinyltransferase